MSDCLHSLQSLEYPGARYEIIVVDAASGDDTASAVKALAGNGRVPPIRYLRSPSPNANAARNIGATAAAGSLLAFIDDDVIVPPRWLTALVDGFEQHPDAGCLGGPIRPIYEAAAPRTCSEHELAGLTFYEGASSKEVRELWGGNMAVRREVFESVGPFREGLAVLQEWEWHERLRANGGTMVYLPEAWLWHRRGGADLALVSVLMDMFRRGYVRGRLGQPFPITDPLRRGSRMLGHAVMRACARGLGECARETGLAVGALARRRRRNPTQSG